MNWLITILVIAVFALIGVFLICYKIPQLLQVILMRAMMNKVTQRGYVSKLRRFKEYVLSFLRVQRR